MPADIANLSSTPCAARPEAAARPGGWHRPALLALLLFAALTLVYLGPIHKWLQDTGQLRPAIAAMGLWVYPLSTLVVALLVGCGVPRLALCGDLGLLLGFWPGLAVVQAGTLIGYYAFFLLTRWGGQGWAMRRWPGLRKWSNLIHDHGVAGVILLRQLPIHGTLVNLGLGLSSVKHRHFLLGTLVGSLPEAIPFTLAGMGLGEASRKIMTGYLAVSLLALAAIWIGCGYLLRKLRQARRTATIVAEADLLKKAGR